MLIGIALAVVLYVIQHSNRVQVMAWKVEPGQYPREVEPPAETWIAARS